MNNSEKMGSGESNWRDSWIALDGWKELSQSKTIMKVWHQARTMDLEENGARFKRNPSSAFKCWEWWQEPPKLLRHFGTKKNRNDEPTLKIFWKRSWRKNMTDENSFLRQPWKWIWEWLREKLEESGKILGKVLWVRAHSKETPLNDWLKGGIAPVELNDLNEITTSK